MTILKIELVHRMPGLPYSDPYAAWEAHTSTCTECRIAMASAALQGGAAPTETLCTVGRPLDVALRYAIEGQHDASQLN